MTENTINWGALMADGAAEFQPVPKGVYDFVVDKCDAGVSTTGKNMWKMVLRIEGGPSNGRTLWSNQTLTQDNPNALRMFFMTMKNLGLTQEFFAQGPSPSQIAAALVGNRGQCNVDHKAYQGSMREDVKIIAPKGVGPGGMAVPMAAGAYAASGPQIPVPGQIATPAVPSSPSIPQPSATPAPVAPSMPTAAAPVAPAAPLESTAPIPAPQNPVVTEEVRPETPPPAAEAPPATPALPPGMDEATYAAFLAFQNGTQQQSAQVDTTPVATPPAAPAPGLPVPPPVNF